MALTSSDTLVYTPRRRRSPPRVAVRRRADDAAFRRQGARRLPEHEQELDLRHRHEHVDAERLEGLQRPQRRGELGPPARPARDDLHLCIIVSTPMKAETGVTASGERSRIW